MNRPFEAYPGVRALAALAAALLGVAFTTAALAAAALLSACGGSETESAATASDARTAVIDVDALGSIDAAAREAADARGAPGEAEAVRYVVRARQAQHGERVAAELVRLGFAPVQLAQAHDGPAVDSLR